MERLDKCLYMFEREVAGLAFPLSIAEGKEIVDGKKRISELKKRARQKREN